MPIDIASCTSPKIESPLTKHTSIQNSNRRITPRYNRSSIQPNTKYDMRFDEFSTNKPRKPKKPRKPLTPAQSLVAAKKRDVAIAKQALQSVKDRQEERKEQERTRKATYSAALQIPRTK